MRVQSGITWFDVDDGGWIGTEIVFDSPHKSRWKLEQKIAEVEDLASEFEVKQCLDECSARGVFICSSIDETGKEAVVKIRMQIPYYQTAYKRPQTRAHQAQPDLRFATQQKVKALEHLTAAGCSSTPALFAWKHQTQDTDGWVPGGYIDYILMERVPGSPPEYWASSIMDKEERAQLRQAFKKAWIECVACGAVHQDRSLRNLVWDRASQKCYIVDWEIWREPRDEDVWRDREYISWGMAWVQSGNYEDMSTWTM